MTGRNEGLRVLDDFVCDALPVAVSAAGPLRAEVVNGVLHVTPAGPRLGFEPADGQRLLDVVDTHPGRDVLVDFSAVEFASSAYVGSLIRVRQRLGGGGRRLVICNVRADVMPVFEIARVPRDMLVPAGPLG